MVRTAPLPPISGSSAKLKRALRIVYADDMPELRDVARLSLTRDGHTIECYPDGVQAFARVSSDPTIDLVMTDHHMPNMNGLQFVNALRQLGFGGKILVFSSELSKETEREYTQRGVDRILYKPVFPSALRQTLAELFAPKR